MKPKLALIRGEDLKNENIDAFLNALGISDDDGKKQPKDEPLRRRTGGKRSRRKDGAKRRPEGA